MSTTAIGIKSTGTLTNVCRRNEKVSIQVPQTKKQTRTERDFAWKMSSPTILVLLVLTVYPLIFTVLYSFTDYNFLKGGVYKWVGIKNYISILSNTYFQTAVLNTFKFTVLSVLFEMTLGVMLAVYVNSLGETVQKILRVLFLLPYLIPTVTVAMVWRIMLSQNYGILNQLLTMLHLPVHNWFMEIGTAFNTILVIDVWQNVPFVFLLVYASLQTVSKSQYEAAKIDGANAYEIFFHVTVPNIKDSLILCAMLRTIDTFRLFDKVNILTGGGPAGSTSTITQFMYNYGIKNLKFGYGSAAALIMTVIVLILSAGYIRKMAKC